MAKERRPVREQPHELLEVHGFDLLADIEAMLRHARQYQREVQRLRGILGRGQTDTSERPPLDAVREHLNRLCEAAKDLSSTLTEVCHVAGVVSPAERSDRNIRERGRRRSRVAGSRTDGGTN